MKRRNFIKMSSIAASGLVISIQFSCEDDKKQVIPSALKEFNSYLRIDTNGIIEILNPVPEIGQGVSTALPMLVAEELNVNWENIIVKQADGGINYEGRNQRAAGSNSVRRFWNPMRYAGASVREMLKMAAAKTWLIDINDCFVKKGYVYNKKNKKRIKYGDLVELASTLEIPQNIILKNDKSLDLIGTSPLNKSIESIVKGEIRFGLDTRIEGMLYASVQKCKTYGATVKSFNKEEVLSINGVKDAFIMPYVGKYIERPYEREGVAIIADSFWNVLKGRKALKIDWNLGINKDENTNRLHKESKNLLQKKAEYLVKNDGNATDYINDKASIVHEATYHVPFIVHIPMETVNCTVDLKEDSCELWSTSQMPFNELNFISKFLKLPAERIKLHVPRIGGGFGRRLSDDFTEEALKVAQKVKKPVHFFWTREDDIQLDGCRPFSYHKLTAGLDINGKAEAWIHKQVGTSRHAFRRNNKPYRSEFFPNHFPANLIPNFKQEYTLLKTNIERTLIRAPGNNALAFAVESFIDEIAIKNGIDPLEYRLDLLGKNADFTFDEEYQTVISTLRMRKVLTSAAKKSGWGNSLPKNHGIGIAGYFTFDTYVAHVAKVHVDPRTNELKILSFNSAVDCGKVLNPDGVRAQVEGAIHDGLSATLYQEITFSDGGINQTNFHDYEVLRMSDAPNKIEVSIIENEFPPTGMGEPPYPPVAPALCNAIYDACGVRIRKLPIKNQIKEILQNA